MKEEILKQLEIPKIELTREKADVLIELIRKMPEYPMHFSSKEQEARLQENWRNQVASFFARLGLCIRFLYNPKEDLTNNKEE